MKAQAIDNATSPGKPEVVALPHDDDAERAVLGTIVERGLLDCDLQPSDFFNAYHGAIFRAMQRLHGEGTPIDLALLRGHLRDGNDPESAACLPDIVFNAISDRHESLPQHRFQHPVLIGHARVATGEGVPHAHRFEAGEQGPRQRGKRKRIEESLVLGVHHQEPSLAGE